MKRLCQKPSWGSTRRNLALALLGALALSVFGAYGVFAASAKPDFSIDASPSTQTVTQGWSTTYTLTIERVNGFTGSVTLSAAGLPAGAKKTFRQSDGKSSNVMPPNASSSTLTIDTASNGPTGTWKPEITAKSGKLTHKTTVTLVVQSKSIPNFSVGASPASKTVSQGDEAAYTLKINRTGGFKGSVSLTVSGLPDHTSASWSPGSSVTGTSATLRLQTAPDTAAGTYPLTINGTGRIGGGNVSRSATVQLVVENKQDFQITGDLGPNLAPGVTAPLNLSLTNRNNFAISVTNLAVAVAEATSKPGCSGTQNFQITQVPAARYPITLPANATRTLAELGVADADKPQVTMLDTSFNQDACKTAKISLSYLGSATQ